MARKEPLERVLSALNPGTKILLVQPLADGSWQAEIAVPIREEIDYTPGRRARATGYWHHEEFLGEGGSIDDAIRDAARVASVALELLNGEHT